MIYLHIGPHKTGTTTIQSWLAANRHVLPTFGYVYPGRRANHNYWARAIRRAASGDIPACLRAHLDEIHRTPGPNGVPCDGIISAEALEHLTSAEVQRLRRWLSDNVTIIVYLRAAWHRKASELAQHLKYLEYNRRVLRNLSLAGPERPSLDAVSLTGQSLLERWAWVFGKERIRVRILHKAVLAGGSLLDDFRGVVGLPASQQTNAYSTTEPQNEMADANTLRIQRHLCDYVAPGRWPRPMGRKLGNLILRAGAKVDWDHARPQLVSAAAEREWHAQLANSYAAIAARYALEPSPSSLFAPLHPSPNPSTVFDWGLSSIEPAALLQLLVYCLIDSFKSRGKGKSRRSRKGSPKADRRSLRQWRRAGNAIDLTGGRAQFYRTVLSAARLDTYPPLADDPVLKMQIRACIKMAVEAMPDFRQGRKLDGRHESSTLECTQLFNLFAESLIAVACGSQDRLHAVHSPGAPFAPESIVFGPQYCPTEIKADSVGCSCSSSRLAATLRGKRARHQYNQRT